jgi:hypothetical protein
VLLYSTALHCTALHCTAPLGQEASVTVQHCTALHCTTLHCTALHCTTRTGGQCYCITLRWTTLHYAALDHTALHHTELPAPHWLALHCTIQKSDSINYVYLARLEGWGLVYICIMILNYTILQGHSEWPCIYFVYCLANWPYTNDFLNHFSTIFWYLSIFNTIKLFKKAPHLRCPRFRTLAFFFERVPGFRCLLVPWIHIHQAPWLLTSGSGPTFHLKILTFLI